MRQLLQSAQMRRRVCVMLPQATGDACCLLRTIVIVSSSSITITIIHHSSSIAIMIVTRLCRRPAPKEVSVAGYYPSRYA
jgi:hypothetical protein